MGTEEEDWLPPWKKAILVQRMGIALFLLIAGAVALITAFWIKGEPLIEIVFMIQLMGIAAALPFLYRGLPRIVDPSMTFTYRDSTSEEVSIREPGSTNNQTMVVTHYGDEKAGKFSSRGAVFFTLIGVVGLWGSAVALTLFALE